MEARELTSARGAESDFPGLEPEARTAEGGSRFPVSA